MEASQRLTRVENAVVVDRVLRKKMEERLHNALNQLDVLEQRVQTMEHEMEANRIVAERY